MSLQIKDLGIGKLRKQLKELSKYRITLGVQGPEAEAPHPTAGVPTGLLALWLHFGTANPDGSVKMPARPWVDRAVAEVTDRVRNVAANAASDLIDRRTGSVPEALQSAAEAGTDAMRASFDSAKDWAAPLAKSTKAAKGHDTPLLDTGTVRDAQSWAIRKNGKVVRHGA